MKRAKRMVALILSLVLAVSGLPGSVVASADEPAAILSAAVDGASARIYRSVISAEPLSGTAPVDVVFTADENASITLGGTEITDKSEPAEGQRTFTASVAPADLETGVTVVISQTGKASTNYTLKALARMVFEQTNFDETTGVLTMRLKVLADPIALAAGERVYAGTDLFEKDKDLNGVNQRLAEGYFAFRFDATSMTPITRPSTGDASQDMMQIGQVAVVANSGSSAMAGYLAGDGVEVLHGAQQDQSLSFSQALSTPVAANLSSSGYLVSFNRVTNSQRLGDAYIQFGYEGQNTYSQTVDDDGYITVTELDFQCYAGVEEVGGVTQRAAAKNTDFLYANSFVPVKAGDLTSFRQQFVQGGKSLVQGSAGYMEGFRRYANQQSLIATYRTDLYHYGDILDTTDLIWPTVDEEEEYGYYREAETTVATVNDVPRFVFEHQDKEYTVTDFTAMVTNHFVGDVKSTTVGESPNPTVYAVVQSATVNGVEAGFNGDQIVSELGNSVGETVQAVFVANGLATVTVGGTAATAAPNGDGTSSFTATVQTAKLKTSGVAVVIAQENMESFTYTLKDFSAEDVYELSDPDVTFTVPGGETGKYPRYDVPSYEEEQNNGGNWVPRSHGLDRGTGGNHSYIYPQLTYYINADVAAGAINYPQANMDEFMNSLNDSWRFCLDDGTCLEDLAASGYSLSAETDAGTITGVDKNGNAVTYTIKEVTIQGNVTRYECPNCGHTENTAWSGNCSQCGSEQEPQQVSSTPYTLGKNLAGTKVWKLYNNGTYVMTTPVGVILDYLESEVEYRCLDEQIANTGDAHMRTVTQRAPQLHVTHEAASEDNLIWKLATSGVVILGCRYGVWDRTVKTRLYKDSGRVEAEVGLDASQLLTESGTEDPAYFYVGNTALDGTGTSTVDDVLHNGVALSSILYDQYHATFSDRFPTVTLTPTAETLAAIKEHIQAYAKTTLTEEELAAQAADLPFEITRDRKVQEDNYQEVTAAYDAFTIKYKRNRTVNDVVPGTYVLTSSFTRENGTVLSNTITLEIKKEPDHLHYVKLSLSRAKTQTIKGTPTWEGKVYRAEMDVVCLVPIRAATSNGYSNATETTVINLEEIANQWRVESSDPAQYDIVSGLRENGMISLNKCKTKNINVTFALEDFNQTTGPRAGQPKTGLAGTATEIRDSVRYLTNGSVTYNSQVADGTAFSCLVTVQYGEYSAEIKINFTFSRENNGLQAIEITPADVTDVDAHTIRVPLDGESAASKSVEVTPVDYYGSTLLWTGATGSVVYYSGGDGQYKLNAVDSTGRPIGLPSTIRISGNSVVVDPMAPALTFYLQAVYEHNGVKSNLYEVAVTRQSNRPKKLQNPAYDTTTLTAPGYGQADVTASFTQATVINQYGETLIRSVPTETAPGSGQYTYSDGDYTLSFKLSGLTETAAQYISINPVTGLVTVKALAPACTFKVDVKATTPNGEVSETKSVSFTVVRESAKYQSFAILGTKVEGKEFEVTYPASRVQLYAEGSNQYNADPTQMTELEPDQVEWKLVSATYPNGTTASATSPVGGVYTLGILKVSTDGEVTLTGATSKANIPTTITVTATAKGEATATGTKTETRDFTVSVPASVPTRIYIPNDSQQFNEEIPSQGNDVTVTLNAEVQDQFNIRMPAETANLVWSAVEEKTGFVLNGNKVTINYQVVTSPTAENPSPNLLEVVATYTDANGTISSDIVPIFAKMNRDNIKVGSVEITGIRLDGAVQANNTVPLPAQAGAGYSGSQTYTMTKLMKDNYQLAYGGTAYWTVEKVEIKEGSTAETTWASGSDEQMAFVQFVSPSGDGKFRGGSIQFKYNETVRDALLANKQVVVTVKVTSDDKAENGQPVTDTEEVFLKLDASVPATAQASLDPDREQRIGTWDAEEGSEDCPTVPTMDIGTNSIEVFATVYDQYGVAMADTYKARMKIEGEIDSNKLAFTQRTQGSALLNSALLTLKWQFGGQFINVLAWPEDGSEAYATTLRIDVHPGPKYPLRLVRMDSTTEFEIPYWTTDDSVRAGNLLPEGDNVSLLDTLCAQVWNNKEEWMYYDAGLADNKGTRPIWTFLNPENYFTTDGVAAIRVPDELDLTRDQNGPMTTITADTLLKTEHFSLQVSNRAAELVPAGSDGVDVSLIVHTSDSSNGYREPSEYFTKTITVRMTREDARPWFMYMRDVDANGVLSIDDGTGAKQTSLHRPSKEAGTVNYTVVTDLYDRYGILLTDKGVGIPNSEIDPEQTDDGAVVSLTLMTRDLPNDSRVLLEEITETVEDPDQEEPQEGEPAPEPRTIVVGYKIYHVEYTEVEPEPQPEGEEPGEPQEKQYEITTKKLMAQFDRRTGQVTITADCDAELLPYLVIQAHYGPLNGTSANGKKFIKIPITQDASRPASATVQHGSARYSNGVIELTSTEEEPFSDTLTPVVLDQYGEPYQGNMLVSWLAFTPHQDENGNYLYDTAYAEMVTTTVINEETGEEEEGPQVKREEEDQLIRLSNGTLLINPAQFDQERSMLVYCQIFDPGNTASANQKVILGDVLTVRMKKEDPKPHGPGYFVPTDYTIRFDAGELGKLVGESTVVLADGETLEALPGVKANDGYGFIGWSIDGSEPVDVMSMEIREDVVFRALYRKVSDGAFVVGYGDGTFHPKGNITRAEFVTMVVLALGGYDPETDYGEPFSDVRHGSWYTNYIAFAKLQRFVSGYEDGSFRPNQVITRGEAARILAVAAGLTLENTKSFPDVPENRFFSTSIAALKDCGAAHGFMDGTFRPFQFITRAEAVTLILGLTNNALDEVQKENIKMCGYSPFTDFDRNYWAFAYILRAAGLA